MGKVVFKGILSMITEKRYPNSPKTTSKPYDYRANKDPFYII
jgi:hypothetical protein